MPDYVSEWRKDRRDRRDRKRKAWHDYGVDEGPVLEARPPHPTPDQTEVSDAAFNAGFLLGVQLENQRIADALQERTLPEVAMLRRLNQQTQDAQARIDVIRALVNEAALGECAVPTDDLAEVLATGQPPARWSERPTLSVTCFRGRHRACQEHVEKGGCLIGGTDCQCPCHADSP